MNKIKGFILGLVLALLSLGLVHGYSLRVIGDQDPRFMRLYADTNIFGSPDLLEAAMDEGSIPYLGSSELTTDEDKPYWPFAVFRSEDLNLLRIGEGGYQSIIQAGIIGAIGDEVQSKKVIFNLSPQWFTPEGIKPEAVLNFMTYENLDEFFKNESISDQTKEAFSKRLIELTEGYDDYQGNIQILVKANKDKDPLAKAKAKLILTKERIKKSFQLAKALSGLEKTKYDLVDLP